MRLMLEETRSFPTGWTGHRTVRALLDALDAIDPTLLQEVSIACEPKQAAAIARRIHVATTSAFHLLGGDGPFETLDFHDRDVDKAGRAMDAVGPGPCTPVRRVPIGGRHYWWPEKDRVLLDGVSLPETARAALAGQPLDRLVRSPMLDDGRIIADFTTEDGCTLVDLEKTRTGRHKQ